MVMAMVMVMVMVTIVWIFGVVFRPVYVPWSSLLVYTVYFIYILLFAVATIDIVIVIVIVVVIPTELPPFRSAPSFAQLFSLGIITLTTVVLTLVGVEEFISFFGCHFVVSKDVYIGCVSEVVESRVSIKRKINWRLRG